MHTFNTAWQKLFGSKSAAEVAEAAATANLDVVSFAREQLDRLGAEDPYHGFDQSHGPLLDEIVRVLRAAEGPPSPTDAAPPPAPVERTDTEDTGEFEDDEP